MIGSSRDSRANWIIVDNNHIKSYGNECSIFVFSELEVIRDVVLIEPSLESILNKIDNEEYDQVTKVFIQIDIANSYGSEDNFDKSFECRFIGSIDKNQKEVLGRKIKKELSVLDITVLKSENRKRRFMLGVGFERSDEN